MWQFALLIIFLVIGTQPASAAVEVDVDGGQVDKALELQLNSPNGEAVVYPTLIPDIRAAEPVELPPLEELQMLLDSLGEQNQDTTAADRQPIDSGLSDTGHNTPNQNHRDVSEGELLRDFERLMELMDTDMARAQERVRLAEASQQLIKSHRLLAEQQHQKEMVWFTVVILALTAASMYLGYLRGTLKGYNQGRDDMIDAFTRTD